VTTLAIIGLLLLVLSPGIGYAFGDIANSDAEGVRFLWGTIGLGVALAGLAGMVFGM
jgi:hypothetical protein